MAGVEAGDSHQMSVRGGDFQHRHIVVRRSFQPALLAQFRNTVGRIVAAVDGEVECPLSPGQHCRRQTADRLTDCFDNLLPQCVVYSSTRCRSPSVRKNMPHKLLPIAGPQWVWEQFRHIWSRVRPYFSFKVVQTAAEVARSIPTTSSVINTAR